MSVRLAAASAALFSLGTYLVLQRKLSRIIIGLGLLSHGANLLFITAGRRGLPAIIGAGDSGEFADPLPQALMLTAIVITFAVSAFLLALIYRSWQLGQADTVVDDEEDIAVRDRGAVEEDEMDDETSIEDEDEDATTDFIGTETAPITVLHHRDLDGIRDAAPVDRPGRAGRDGGDAR